MPSHRILAALLLTLLVSVGAPPVFAQDTAEPPAAPTKQASPLEVYVHTLSHRDARLATGIIGHRLSPRGTVEVQPGSNTIVVRDIAPILDKVKQALLDFDQPPASVRLELRVVKAGPKRAVSPPAGSDHALPEELIAKLQSLLRYDSYQVLAQAALTSLEGETVDYSLGPDYSVSFKLGSVLGQRKLQLQNFRIVERLSSAKGRGVEPRQLFQADLNVWLDRPFTLVLTRDEERQEALLVALTVRVEPTRPAQPDGR